MQNQHRTRALMFAVGLAGAIAIASHAEPLNHDEYETEKDTIQAEHDAALSACDQLIAPAARDARANDKDSPPADVEFQDSTNAKGICVEQANADRTVALAQLEYQRSGSDGDRLKLAIAKAEAARDVAQQKCDELTPNANEACINAADAEEVRAKAAAN